MTFTGVSVVIGWSDMVATRRMIEGDCEAAKHTYDRMNRLIA
jgi:hypothetical protein